MTLHKSSHKPKKKLTKAKAAKILKDKKVRGKAFSKKQERFFRAVASGKARKA